MWVLLELGQLLRFQTRHMKIVGISGKARTGKDTFAEYLVDNLGYTRISFAEPLKKCLYILNPWVKSNDGYTTLRYQSIIDEYGEDNAKVTYKEVRRLQQCFGTEVVRDNFGANFWVDLAFKRIADQKLQKVVIPDQRFHNEIAAVSQQTNHVLFKVISSRNTSSDTHVSEQDLPNYLFQEIIENNGSLDEYYSKIEEVAEKYSL